MSSMGSIGSGANDLLWALKHQFQAFRHGQGLGHGAAGSASLSSALVGASGASNAAGLDGSALLAPAETSTTGTIGSTGTSPGIGAVRLGPDMLAALLQIQEQAASTNGQSSVQGAATQTVAATAPVPGQGRGVSFAQNLFGAIDTNGNGQISKGELEAAFASIGRDPTQADKLFAKLDANGDGSVTPNELNRALRHGHHHGGAMDALTSLGQMQSSNTVTNADGSSTTTVTYANGTRIEITIPAAAAQNGTTGSGTDATTNTAAATTPTTATTTTTAAG